MKPLEQLFVKLTAAERRKLRQQQRAAKREDKARNHQYAGLNGKRAVARRLRQIERGQLQVTT
jgi:hypothetical protein